MLSVISTPDPGTTIQTAPRYSRAPQTSPATPCSAQTRPLPFCAQLTVSKVLQTDCEGHLAWASLQVEVGQGVPVPRQVVLLCCYCWLLAAVPRLRTAAGIAARLHTGSSTGCTDCNSRHRTLLHPAAALALHLADGAVAGDGCCCCLGCKVYVSTRTELVS